MGFYPTLLNTDVHKRIRSIELKFKCYKMQVIMLFQPEFFKSNWVVDDKTFDSSSPPPTSLREDYYQYHRTATFKIYLFESNVLFCCSTNEQHKDAACTIVVFKYFKPNILVLISIYLREA